MEKEGLNKEKLIVHVAEKTGLTKAQAKKAVEEVFDTISDFLSKGEKFQYIGFGSFSVRKRAARMGINPITKEKMKIKAKKVPYFTPGKKLAERVK
jgi:DNA-binding protein HU-beta